MKTNLTVEQSAELIRLGINPERASIQMPVDAPYRTSGIRLAPVFNIGDLMAMLPPAIGAYHASCVFCISWDCKAKVWRAYYLGHDDFDCTSTELIDALYELAVMLRNKKYI